MACAVTCRNVTLNPVMRHVTESVTYPLPNQTSSSSDALLIQCIPPAFVLADNLPDSIDITESGSCLLNTGVF